MNEIRDRRDKHWFWVDDAVIDAHATALGPFGLALYAVLARQADDDGAGAITRVTIRELWGDAWVHAVWRKRFLLEQRGLVTIHERSSDVLRYTLRACPSADRAEDAAP